MSQIVLTGITPSGIPHLGNYVGAIRPAIQASKNNHTQSFYFLANYHALIKCHDADTVHQSTLAVAATWLACGLNPEQVIFYRQSDIPEILELNWILSCVSPKGLLNRAHAYKAAIQENLDKGIEDTDHGIEMGLYCYPVLMSADILMFNAHKVPVGRDQLQHLEMARDIAQRFNHRYQSLFHLPEAIIEDNVAVLAGLDGRKMSKSYGNTIPLFDDEKKLRKNIMKIVTNSLEPGQAKSTENSTLFDVYKAFASEEEIKQMAEAYQQGIAWGEAKQIVFEKINQELKPLREQYNKLIASPAIIEDILQAGAQKARQYAQHFLQEIRDAVGIRPLK